MIRVEILQEGNIDLPVYDSSSLTKGEPLTWGVDAGSYNGTVLNTLVKISGNDPTNIFAILAETPSVITTGNRQTPVINKALVQLTENHKVWKVYYDLAAANDLDVTSSTSTILTHGSGDQDLDGGWLYINSGTGAGQLRYIKGADATTKTVNTAFTTTPDSSSDFILIRPEGISTGGNDLSASPSNLLRSVVSAGGREILVLKNWIEGPSGTKELDITQNPDLELDGLNSRGVRFFAHIVFLDTTFSGTGVA